MMQTDIHPDKW